MEKRTEKMLHFCLKSQVQTSGRFIFINLIEKIFYLKHETEKLFISKV